MVVVVPGQAVVRHLLEDGDEGRHQVAVRLGVLSAHGNGEGWGRLAGVIWVLVRRGVLSAKMWKGGGLACRTAGGGVGGGRLCQIWRGQLVSMAGGRLCGMFSFTPGHAHALTHLIKSMRRQSVAAPPTK